MYLLNATTKFNGTERISERISIDMNDILLKIHLKKLNRTFFTLFCRILRKAKKS